MDTIQYVLAVHLFCVLGLDYSDFPAFRPRSHCRQLVAGSRHSISLRKTASKEVTLGQAQLQVAISVCSAWLLPSMIEVLHELTYQTLGLTDISLQCICVYMICMHTCMYAHISIYMYMYIHICVCMGMQGLYHQQ